MQLSENQIQELARPLVTIITDFFSSDTKKEKEFELWLKEYRKEKDAMLC